MCLTHCELRCLAWKYMGGMAWLKSRITFFSLLSWCTTSTFTIPQQHVFWVGTTSQYILTLPMPTLGMQVCCYNISCKNQTNIDITVDWLTKHAKKWERAGVGFIDYVCSLFNYGCRTDNKTTCYILVSSSYEFSGFIPRRFHLGHL